MTHIFIGLLGITLIFISLSHMSIYKRHKNCLEGTIMIHEAYNQDLAEFYQHTGMSVSAWLEKQK